jgi:hypothetical protein
MTRSERPQAPELDRRAHAAEAGPDDHRVVDVRHQISFEYRRYANTLYRVPRRRAARTPRVISPAAVVVPGELM